MYLPAAVFNDRPFPQLSFDHRPADKPMSTETLGLELTSLRRWPASPSVKRGAFAVTGGGKIAIRERGGQMTSSEMFGNVMSEKKSFLKQKSARHAITESLVWVTVGHTSKELN